MFHFMVSISDEYKYKPLLTVCEAYLARNLPHAQYKLMPGFGRVYFMEWNGTLLYARDGSN